MSTNTSKKRREELRAKLDELRAFVARTGGDEAGRLISYADEIAGELSSRRYGLCFEEHEEKVDAVLASHLPAFSRVEELCISRGGEPHFLIEGDNLPALRLLLKTHRERVGVIYIDPPYNTGKGDFIYDDKMVDPEDGFRHSKWLSFMNVRLRAARALLAPDGVLFIQIDDHEYAALKLLCDAIFDESNAIGPFIQNKQNSKNDTANIQKNHEYILVYRKRAQKNAAKTAPTLIDRGRYEREVLREGTSFYYVGDSITTRGEGGTLAARSNLGYTVYYHPGTGDKTARADYDPALAGSCDDESAVYTDERSLTERGYIPIRPPRVRGKLGSWTWDITRFQRERDALIIRKTGGAYRILKKKAVDPADVYERDGRLYCRTAGNARSILHYATSGGASALSKTLGASGAFSNPKNVDMIKYLIGLYPPKDAWVLDFFAGSGTTGQAVLELNRSEGAHRRFILVQNTQNAICRQVTLERLRRFYEQELTTSGLEFYQIEWIPARGRLYYEYADALLRHTAELIELECGRGGALAESDGALARLLAQDDAALRGKRLFIGHDVLPDAEQEERMGALGIRLETVPEYYYREEQGSLWT